MPFARGWISSKLASPFSSAPSLPLSPMAARTHLGQQREKYRLQTKRPWCKEKGTTDGEAQTWLCTRWTARQCGVHVRRGADKHVVQEVEELLTPETQTESNARMPVFPICNPLLPICNPICNCSPRVFPYLQSFMWQRQKEIFFLT